MKDIILVLFFSVHAVAHTQGHSLEKIWETDTVVAIPESVLPGNGILYVSLIDGEGWAADGKGGVAKISLDGKILDASWITGLNAPKGLGIVGNHLYVADINEVVVIDIAKGKIEKKIAIDSAKNLNDITVDDKGAVYVSDSKTAMIWKLENDSPVLYLDNMKGVNGLKISGDNLFIASGKSFIKADSKKNIQPVTQLPQGGDGVEPVGNGDFIVTAWSGYIFYVHADGKIETLLETFQQKKNTADIGYDPKKRIIYVPSFNGKTVAAYLLK